MASKRKMATRGCASAPGMHLDRHRQMMKAARLRNTNELHPSKIAAIVALRKAGYGPAQVAQMLGVSRLMVSRYAGEATV